MADFIFPSSSHIINVTSSADMLNPNQLYRLKLPALPSVIDSSFRDGLYSTDGVGNIIKDCCGVHTDVASSTVRDNLPNPQNGDTVSYLQGLTNYLDGFIGGVWRLIEKSDVSIDFEALVVTNGSPTSFEANCDLYVDWGDGVLVSYPSTGGNPDVTVLGSAVTPTSEVKVYGSGVTQFWFKSDTCTSINIVKNGLQVSAQDMFKNLHQLLTFLASPDSFAGVSNFQSSWSGCTSITAFPTIDTSSGTNLREAWRGCSALLAFPFLNTSLATSVGIAWGGCNSLTTFPLLDTSNVTNFAGAWTECTALTSFPVLNTSLGTNFGTAWSNCSSLVTFPLLDTSSGTLFQWAWRDCTSLISFPLISTALGINFHGTWQNCSSLISFPNLNTTLGYNLGGTWHGCTSLVHFPALDTGEGRILSNAWFDCVGLVDFPLIDTLNATTLANAWGNCSSLVEFPALDMSSTTNFSGTWKGCTSLVGMPSINTNAGTLFVSTWEDCTSLLCLTNVSTLLQTDTTSMFASTPALVSPDAISRSIILTGVEFTSADPCGGSPASTAYLRVKHASMGTATFDLQELTIDLPDTTPLLIECVHIPQGGSLVLGANLIDANPATSLTGGTGVPTDVLIGVGQGITFRANTIPASIPMTLQGKVYSGTTFIIEAVYTTLDFAGLTDAEVSALPWVNISSAVYSAPHGQFTVWNDILTSTLQP